MGRRITELQYVAQMANSGEWWLFTSEMWIHKATGMRLIHSKWGHGKRNNRESCRPWAVVFKDWSFVTDKKGNPRTFRSLLAAKNAAEGVIAYQNGNFIKEGV